MPNGTSTLTALQGQQAFLVKVVQTLQSDWHVLDDHLQQARWSQAKDKAHQLKGIFSLLDAGPLLDSLQYIEDVELPLISEGEFRQDLQQQVDAFCAKIEQYIDIA